MRRVRLVAAPVSEQTATLWRMKAKKETKGHNPSAAVLELKICLTAKLVSITVGMGHLYRLCYQRMRDATGRDLSLQKFTRYMAKMPSRLVSLHV